MGQLKDYVKRNVKPNISNWISNKRERISLNNPSLLKGKDIGFFKDVVNYLHERGLEPKLSGGVVNSALKGNPRNIL